jgi:hypothetical protein
MTTAPMSTHAVKTDHAERRMAIDSEIDKCQQMLMPILARLFRLNEERAELGEERFDLIEFEHYLSAKRKGWQ